MTGRFLQNEPLLDRRLLSHYIYAVQNPVNFVDPWGLQEAPCDCNDAEAALKALEGALYTFGIEVGDAGQLRLDYSDLVTELNKLKGKLPDEQLSKLRSQLQVRIRGMQNTLADELVKPEIAKRKNQVKKNPGKFNQALTARMRIARTCGRGLTAIAITLEIVDIIEAPPEKRLRKAAEAGIIFAGAQAGAEGGAAFGALGGPVGVVIGTLVGGAVGALIASDALHSPYTGSAMPIGSPAAGYIPGFPGGARPSPIDARDYPNYFGPGSR